MSVAVWRIQDMIYRAGGDKAVVKPQPMCEYGMGKVNINTLFFDNEHSDTE